MRKNLEAYFQSSSFLGWWWNPQTRQYMVDDHWYKMVGRTPNDGESNEDLWTRIVHPEDRLKHRVSIKKHLEGKTDIYENIYRLLHGDGHWIWVMARGKIIEFDSNGNPCKVAGTYSDITQSMHNQKEVENTNNILKDMIAHLPFSVAMFDKEMKYVATSEKWNKYFNFNESVIGQDIYSSLPNAGNKWVELHQRGLLGEELESECEMFLDDNQQEKWRKWDIKPWRQGSKISGIIITIEDMTEKVMMKKKLEEEQLKLIHASRLSSLGEMAGNIAHEINNPLSVIMGHAEMMGEISTGSEEKDQLLKSSSQQIMDTSERIFEIIKGLKNYCRNEQEIALKNYDLKDIIKETMAICSVNLKNSQIKVDLELEKDVVIKGKSVEISQVLVNLISNAKDAIKSQPSPWIKIKAFNEGDRVKICVIDSGKGIDKKIVDKICTPFFTTKPAGEGTGLGLSISKNIIESQSGKLWIDTEAENTTFCLSLQRGSPIYQSN